jgi:hypothetical protein
MTQMKPFQEAASTTMGDLVIETDEDVLSISGSIDIHKDAEGLKHLEAIVSVLQAAAARLKSEDLPSKADGPRPAGPKIRNPFA